MATHATGGSADRSEPPWEELRAAVSGVVSLPGDIGYDNAAPWVVSAPVFRPAAVLAATTPQDVAAVVGWAARNGLRVAVQCTGHHATRIDDDVVLLDTRAMNELRIDADAMTVTLGPGVRWAQVLEAAGEHGLVPVCGSAPGISAVGFLTGGGVGPMSRTLGVGADRVRAMSVVTGDGQMRRVTPDENADLFWGLRGGKGTLGIVVEVEVELVPLPTFWGGAIYFTDPDDIAAVVRAWTPWADALPDEGNTSIAIMQLPADAPAPPQITGTMALAVRFAWLGDEERGRELARTVADVATPVFGTWATMPGAELGAVHSDPTDPMPFRDEGFLMREFPAEAADTLLDVIGPDSGSTLAYAEVRRLGGRAAQDPEHPDAFGGRVGQWGLWIGSPPLPDLDTLLSEFSRVLDPMRKWSANRSMPNFLISDDPDDMRRLWAPEAFERLRALAGQYDPQGVLAVGQVVPR